MDPRCLETQLLHFVLDQFHPRKAMRQPPSIKLIIQGATDHSSLLKNAADQNNNIYIVLL